MVSVKTLNHRGLDVHVHAPSAADPSENAIRPRQGKIARGHVEVRISSAPDSGTVRPGPERELLETYFQAFREAAAAHGLDEKADFNAAFRVPGMFRAFLRN